MTDPEAPYGRKENGEPKKMPVTHPDHPLYKPARGGPASGAGYGGPAKGAHDTGGFGEQPQNIGGVMRVANPEAYAERQAAKRARGERFVDHIEHLAFNAESEQTQLAAAIAGANRLLGAVPTKLVGGDADEGDKPIDLKHTISDDMAAWLDKRG